jgi:glycosyltransferase involved in cell wall biosynthesis
VQSNRLPTKCYAVDTWEGDEHAGFYDNSIFEAVTVYNENQYYTFSRLLRMTFDDALSHFSNRSIDLLHIDGLHTYEAVKHDFESWLPKLSRSGVVLFHDINVKERDFGVWKFWEEIANLYPHIAFDHSAGLGVLMVGDEQNLVIKELVNQFHCLSGKHQIALMFARLGQLVDVEHHFSLAVAQIDEQDKRISEFITERDEYNHQQQQKTFSIQSEKINELENRLQKMVNSSSWRMTKPIRKITKSIRKRARKIRNMFRVSMPKVVDEASTSENDNNLSSIALKIFHRQQSELTPDEIRAIIASFTSCPLFSVLTPVYNTPLKWLERMIESLQEQSYQHWELCIVDDCSTTPDLRKALENFAQNDPRINVLFAKTNSGISAASNAALNMAKGDYVALLDHDDELTPDALFWFAKEIHEHPEADFLYSDECKIDDTYRKNLFHYFFKPDWSPELLLNTMYTGHLTVYKKSLVQHVGNFRSEYDFSQDYDLALRASEQAHSIRHIERVLYLWRAIDGSAAKGGKSHARNSNLRALNDAAHRRGLPVRVLEKTHANHMSIVHDHLEKVSIIIPSDSYQNLKRSIDAILLLTAYGKYEIVVVCNAALARTIEQEYSYTNSVKCSNYDKPFNFSDKCNQGARESSGEIVLFYNDDVIPQEKAWLSILIEYLYLPGVGGVSPKLVYENDRIQYAGMISGTPGFVGTAYNGVGKDEHDDFLSMHLWLRNVTVLSGACFAIKKSVFELVGGFNAVDTPNGHSDVDFSYRILEHGLRCVYTPYTVLTHIGNHTWHSKKDEKDKSDIFLLKRWGKYLGKDPYFTASMKEALYTDFTYTFQIFADSIDPDKTYAGKNILLVSHDLTLSGAPLVLLSGAKSLLERGHFCVVIAPADGAMRKTFETAGVPVVIDAMLWHNHWLTERFMKNFDLVLVNTIVGYPVINQLAEYSLPIIWWLHEAAGITEYLTNKSNIILPALKRCNSVITVSNYAKGFLQGFSSKCQVINNGIEDDSSFLHVSIANSEKIRFCLVGTLESRKAQDVYVEAIAALPREVREKAEFTLMGRLLPSNAGFYNTVLGKAKKMSEVIYRDDGTHEEALQLISDSDVLVCPSRDDPAPLVTIEALMLGKPVIISKNVGIGKKLEDGVSCLIVETGNSEALSRSFKMMIEQPEKIASMGKQARSVYEKYFTMKKFKDQFCTFVESFL